MENPLISVIIPVYNVEKFISQCLDSLINQTYSKIEIITIDDGSTDNSLIILQEYAKTDERLKVVAVQNGGVSEARNKGIELAQGEYIMFVDSDDWIDIKMIETLLSHSTDYLDLVQCSYTRSYVDKFVPRLLNVSGVIPNKVFKRKLIGMIKEELSDPSQADSFVIPVAKLYKSKIIKDYKIRFISLKKIGTNEDLMFNLDYCNNIKGDILILNEPLYYYRKTNGESITSTYKPQLFNQWKSLFSILKNNYLENDKDFNEAFNNRICLSIIGLGLNELKNKNNFYTQLKKIKFILNDPIYRASFAELNLSYFPMHWKFFFLLAKYNIYIGVYLMLYGIDFFVKKKI
ncbi:hypothetical protein ATE49_13900 [Elizabethkingia miricola]|uniref:Glycosyl transferase family 2 n=1 Tax=Elizabethkingia miricola TaxID=172045 RepID=A0ABY3NE91_ELIMR|nr:MULTISPECIES: glycosyltransferase [Elizabethkingia]OBS13154.1 hypothetical protein ATE49_13900 [Elizabethkingia miricola]TYO89745.1 glycosyl transferase family 2 [Elizabethkingia miricola]